MKRLILGTAATGFGLMALGAPTVATAQEISEELTMKEKLKLALEMDMVSCDDVAPPCLTDDNMVLLKNGKEVTLAKAYEALGIAAPRDEAEAMPVEDEVLTDEGATAGEEAVADIEHADVVEEEQLADELAGDMTEEMAEDMAEVPPIEEAMPDDMPVDPVAETEVDPEVVENPAAEEPEVIDAPVTEETIEYDTAAETPLEEALDAAEEEAAQDEVLLQDQQTNETLEAAMTEEAQEAQAAEEAALAAEMEAEQTAAAAAAVDDPEAETGVEVTTETVAEEDARSSADEVAPATTTAKKDDGLNDTEKLLLGAVGAVVLSQILGDNDEVVANSGDRVVVENNGQLRVIKDDDALLRQPGAQMTTETFPDGSTRTTLNRENGSQVITIRAADGRVLRRDRVLADGRRVTLFDDTQNVTAVDVSALPEATQKTVTYQRDEEEAALRAALAASQADGINRTFSLNQIRSIRAVRELAPEIELTNVNFRTGSAAITPSEAEELAALGRAMRDAIAENPREVFLVEGHTDAVGNASYNLALSDRRAESLALALTEYFDVPPENMIVQGYGERYLKVPTVEAERANRRAAVRVITGLLGIETAEAR